MNIEIYILNIQRAGRVAKHFKFDIRSNVSSKPFTVNATSVKMTADGDLIDAYGKRLSVAFPFTVDLRTGWIGLNSFSFNTSRVNTGYANVKPGSFTVTISTGDDTDNYGAGPRLVGSGDVIELD